MDAMVPDRRLEIPAIPSSRVDKINDAVEIRVPPYLHVLTGHYVVQSPRYYARRYRGTDDWLIIATLAGSGRFGSGNAQFIANEREIVLYRAGTPHEYTSADSSSNWELMWAHFHPRSHWLEWLAFTKQRSGIMHVRIDADSWPGIIASFQSAHDFASMPGAHNQDLAMHQIESILLACVGTELQKADMLDERISAAIAVINSNLRHEIDIRLLARSVALSESRFAHLFREQVGTTPMQYVDLQRIQRAKRLLERTSNSITQIASEVGYDPVYFSSRFKQLTGISPREFRRQAHQVSSQPMRLAGAGRSGGIDHLQQIGR